MNKVILKRYIKDWAIIGLLLVLISIYPTIYRMSSETILVTVKEKERISYGSGDDLSHKFIIYTENEVFENTDSWLFLKFNSTDFQRKLELDGRYIVKVSGWRIPFLSWYRNIVKIEQVKK